LNDEQFSSLTGDGLVLSGNTLALDLATNSGLTFSSGELTIDSSIAGSGLAWNSGVLSVSGLTSSGLANDTLDFGSFADSMFLDANTNINLGALTLSTSGTGALDFNSTGQVSFAGNVDAENGLDISGGALTINNQAITQLTGGQVTFAGNLDANGGIDVSGNLTVTGDTSTNTLSINSETFSDLSGFGLEISSGTLAIN